MDGWGCRCVVRARRQAGTRCGSPPAPAPRLLAPSITCRAPAGGTQPLRGRACIPPPGGQREPWSSGRCRCSTEAEGGILRQWQGAAGRGGVSAAAAAARGRKLMLMLAAGSPFRAPRRRRPAARRECASLLPGKVAAAGQQARLRKRVDLHHDGTPPTGRAPAPTWSPMRASRRRMRQGFVRW